MPRPISPGFFRRERRSTLFVMPHNLTQMVAESAHRKVDLAREQLQTAVRLFLDQTSMVSALTLAGAAEEMLGQEAKRRIGSNALDERYGLEREFLELLYRRPIEPSEHRDDLNYPRNAVKHFRSEEESEVSVDLEEAATWMIVRALTNHRMLDFPPLEVEGEFDEWFYENVVGY